MAGLIRLESDATELSDEGKGNNQEMDDCFGNGDDNCYVQGMGNRRPLIKKTAELVKQGIEDNYVYGPAGDAGGEAVDWLFEGFGNLVPIMIEAGKQLHVLN